MLIYLDRKSARILRSIVIFYLRNYVYFDRPDITENILNQLDEGLKNYEKE